LVSELKAKRGTELPDLVLAEALSAGNHRSIDAWIDLAYHAGCDRVRFSVFRHWRGEFASQALSPEQISAVCRDLERSRDRLELLSLSHNLDNILMRYRLGETAWLGLPCYAGWFHSRILVDGTVLPCSTGLLPMGNLNDHSFEQIWNGPEYRAFRRRASSVQGLATLSQCCDCDWCVLSPDNLQVHRYARRFSRLIWLGRQARGMIGGQS
jgi:radical SAM protein with 4Fe4S-binding SPASM domain